MGVAAGGRYRRCTRPRLRISMRRSGRTRPAGLSERPTLRQRFRRRTNRKMWVPLTERRFGEPDSATFGQTFTVAGAGTGLGRFSFHFDDFIGPDGVDLAACIHARERTKATGPQRFASGPLSSTGNGAGGMEVVPIDAGGVQRVSGQRFVAFYSASLFFDGIEGSSVGEWSRGMPKPEGTPSKRTTARISLRSPATRGSAATAASAAQTPSLRAFPPRGLCPCPAPWRCRASD